MAQIRLLIADDNASVHGQLPLLLRMGEDGEVVGEGEAHRGGADGPDEKVGGHGQTQADDGPQGEGLAPLWGASA